jgi:glutaredoxin
MLRRFFRRSSPAPSDRAPVPVTLYTRPGCHLCDVMKAELARARTSEPFALTEVDIDSDPALTERHGRSIPVLEIGGRAAFKGRLEARDFETKLERLAREWRAAADETAGGSSRER